MLDRGNTFFCISKSNLMLFSVTILGDFPCATSGIVANMSWQKIGDVSILKLK